MQISPHLKIRNPAALRLLAVIIFAAMIVAAIAASVDRGCNWNVDAAPNYACAKGDVR